MSSVFQSNLHAVHALYGWLTYPLQAPPHVSHDTCQREEGLLDIRLALKIVLLILLVILTVDQAFRDILVDLDPAIIL